MGLKLPTTLGLAAATARAQGAALSRPRRRSPALWQSRSAFSGGGVSRRR